MVDTVTSLSLTNLDSTPFIANTAGEGAPGNLRSVTDFAAATTGGLGSTSSTYLMVRLPTTAKVKTISVWTKAALDSNGSPTLAINVGTQYSSSTIDGTLAANQGTLISATTFMSAILFGSATTLKVSTINNMNGNLVNSPLWKQAGLSADPGGFIDLVIAVQAVAATAVAGNIVLECQYGM